MAKVFIADPALKSHHGHHYSVTRRFSDAVEMADVEVVWLVNKSFNTSQEDRQAKFKIDLAFSKDTYDGYKKSRKNTDETVNKQKHASLAYHKGQSKHLGTFKGKFERAPRIIRLVVRTINRLSTSRLTYLLDPHTVVGSGENTYRELRKARHAVIKKIIDFTPRPLRLVVCSGCRFIRGRPINIHNQQSVMLRNIVRKEDDPLHTPGDVIEKLRPENEIYSALCRHGFTPEDTVIFHTCDAHTYRDVLSLYVNVLFLSQWNTLPFFILSTPYDIEVMPHNKTGKKADQSVQHMRSLGLIGTRIFLFAENDLLAKQLSSDWNTHVSGLYIPYTGGKKFPSRTDDGPVTFTYLGAARTEKGFPSVAEFVTSFLSGSNMSDIRFVIQVSPQIMGYTPDVKNAVDMLRLVDDERLVLVDDVQSPEDYKHVLLQADVIFLAYEKSRYTIRSSGIAIEAIENGKNVIATSGTFPSYIAGKAGISISEPGDISKAVTMFLDNIEMYRDEALARRTWLLEKCNVSNVHAVLSIGKEIMIENYMFKYLQQGLETVNTNRWRRLL